MNFTELYQRIRSIDEGTASEPTAPGGVIKTKNADGTVSYKPKVPGERLTSTLPANQAAKTTDTSDKDKNKSVNETRSDYTAQEMTDILSGKKSQKQVDDEAEKTRGPDKNAKKVKEQQLAEECGDMPVGMMGMSSHQGQQDSVTMNISMNGSGAGGIRDLMSILRNIESSDNTDVHSHDVSKLFGGDDIEVAFDEEMDGGFSSATTEPNTATAGIDAVTATGNDLASKGIEAPKVNGGGNPMHEALTSRLHQLYQAIKEDTSVPGTRPPFLSSAFDQRGKAIDPVRDSPVDVQKQKVKPQANRPGLAPEGDPKLWDIQFELQKQGYKIKVDGLNGPATEKAARLSGMVKDANQNTANPTAASRGYDVGHTIGSGIGWIETAWRNLKQGFGAGQAGLEEGNDLEKVRNKYNKYDEAYNPNSVDAEHRRSLEKSHEDSLKKKAEDGDEAAKKRLQALKDKKERMRNDYNARMER